MKNYVKFEPVITSNVEYVRLDFYLNNYQKRINIGDYIPKDAYLRANFYLKNNVDELTVFTFNGVNIGYRRSSVDDTAFNIGQIYNYDSPQEVDITIDEYIRYEDIVQPYPAFYEFTDEDKNLVTWGSKVKVGTTITRIKAFFDSNLLKDLYTISYPKLNGISSSGSKYVVERQMVFTCTATYLLDDNEPKCILSPSRLRIPNSSYKILGYIPDISGHGNHGIIHNSAYAEGSGVNEDGSYQFDGVDDFVTIPTLSKGGKQVLMKVNWQSSIGQGMLYDQRGTAFAIWNSDKFEENETDTIPAYSARNGGNTYIDGILNKNILASQLRNITHNIVATNTMLNGSSVSPTIGCNGTHNAFFTNMPLYDFMLFDEISTDDKILELNEYVGIEAKVELPSYYWDMYGKNNNNAFDIEGNKFFIPNQVQKQLGVAPTNAEALSTINIAFNSESGYVDNGLVFDGVDDYLENANIPAFTDFTVIAKRVWMNKDQPANECFIHKGVINTPISESAFMLEYEITNDTYYRSSSFGGYVNVDRANRPEIITYQTTESYNGISIIKGSSIDTQGLVVGAVTNNYWKGILYKLILYPKTIPLLQINFLKNLMERDEIIDLNNPIFIQE